MKKEKYYTGGCMLSQTEIIIQKNIIIKISMLQNWSLSLENTPER